MEAIRKDWKLVRTPLRSRIVDVTLSKQSEKTESTEEFIRALNAKSGGRLLKQSEKTESAQGSGGRAVIVKLSILKQSEKTERLADSDELAAGGVQTRYRSNQKRLKGAQVFPTNTEISFVWNAEAIRKDWKFFHRKSRCFL